MEPTLNNVSSLQTPPVVPKPKKNIVLRILLVLGVLIALYVVIGIILIMINPLFSFIVWAPFYAVKGFFGERQTAILENKLNNTPVSEFMLPVKVTQSDCVGLLFTTDFKNLNNPRVAPYVDRLQPGQFDTLGVCTTSKGKIVVKSSFRDDGSDLAEIYIDNDGELKKIFEVNETVLEFTEDENGTLFLLMPKSVEGGGMSREAFVYAEDQQTFLKVSDTGDKVTICQIQNPEQCTEWKLKNFTIKPVVNYNPSDEEKKYVLENPIKTLNAAQLQCIKEFTDSTKKHIEDLSDEPLYSCVTDSRKKPFDFDFYLFGNEKGGLVNGTTGLIRYAIQYAHFQPVSPTRIASYHVSYDGFDLYNYPLDSISYHVFKNIAAGKYQVGEMIPHIDNTEAAWARFAPLVTLNSLHKENYKGTDIYTIKTSNRYKIFLLGKTYVVMTYDSNINAAISESTADNVVKQIIDSKPFMPIKRPLLSLSPNEKSFDVIAKTFLRKQLEYAKIFYVKNKTYTGLCEDGQFIRTSNYLRDQLSLVLNGYGTNCTPSNQSLWLGISGSGGFSSSTGEYAYINEKGNFRE